MKTVQNKRAVIIGIFIFIGIGILLTAVLTLGGKKKPFKKTITLNAVFNDVNGLQNGNNIWFAGMKIGTVKRIAFTDNAQVKVEMSIDETVKHYLKQDAMVKIGSDGLIGNRIMLIYGGTRQSAEIESGDFLRTEKPVNSAQMMNTLEESNQNLSVITDNLKSVSNKMAEGKGTVGQILTNDTLANQLKATAATLRFASENLNLLTLNLAKFTNKMQQNGTLANDVVTDTVLFSRLKEASLQIQEASVNARSLTDNLNDVSYKLRDSSNLAGVVFQDQETADNLRATVENLQAGTKKFDENMEALKHNFLFRGYFRKKAKREQQEQEKAQARAGSSDGR